MKVSLIVPLVSLPFFAACAPALHKIDSHQDIQEEEIATRSHADHKQPTEDNTTWKKEKVRKVPETLTREEEAGGMRQALVVYSSELIPVMASPDVQDTKENDTKDYAAEEKRASLGQVRKKTSSLPFLQNFPKPQSKSKGLTKSVAEALARTEYTEILQHDQAPPPLYTPVQSEQELKEELTALEKTGDWSDSGEGKHGILSSYGIQCDLPKSFAPVQLNLDGDFLSSVAKGKGPVDSKQVTSSKKLVCDFPIIINKQVEFYLDQFQNRQRITFKRWLDRSALYLSLIEDELKKAKLPEALVYLAMIESGFNPVAYSPARASGLWQFMPSTALSYGLRIDSWVDERRNPEKATRAAVSYLSALYKRFGDWQLAVAAYNAGEGKIQRGLEKYKAKNFWDLAAKDYLALETKRYVPKLIAAILIAHEPERYGFQPVRAKDVQYETVDVPPGTPLSAIAAAGGYSVEKVRQLNTELLKNKIPRVKGTYSLRVPAGTSTRIAANLQQILADEKIKVVHSLRRGETLSRVGKRYNVSVNMIMQWNNIADARRIRAGRKLALYPNVKADVRTGKQGTKEKGMIISYYKVRDGDSLWSIARKHQVSTQDIKRWNQLDNNLLHPGKKLVIKKS
ncbi:transglycosylase SLT domain-containing protein [Candidatus Electrothrix sp.]|uniref:transglycosylase SLT domain-containing protein n=1 Tax=Candidatus Electrothrix sp. TaxID=2170559 RepID=UPI0040572465